MGETEVGIGGGDDGRGGGWRNRIWVFRGDRMRWYEDGTLYKSVVSSHGMIEAMRTQLVFHWSSSVCKCTSIGNPVVSVSHTSDT